MLFKCAVMPDTVTFIIVVSTCFLMTRVECDMKRTTHALLLILITIFIIVVIVVIVVIIMTIARTTIINISNR